MILQIVKELEAKNIFCTLGTGADNSNGVNSEQYRKQITSDDKISKLI